MSEKQYSNEMRLSVFPADKAGNDKRPDYRATFQISGVEYKASLWKKQTKDGSGRTYLTGPVEQAKPNDSRAADTPAAKSAQTSAQNNDESCPF